MKNEDIVFLSFWAICAVIGIFLAVMKIITAKTKVEISDGLGIIIVAISPFSMVIGGLLLIVGIGHILQAIPTYIIAKLKNIKE